MQIAHTRDGLRVQKLQQSPHVFVGFEQGLAVQRQILQPVLVRPIEVNQQGLIAGPYEPRFGSGCWHTRGV